MNEYEYKSVVLTSDVNTRISNKHCDDLNSYFSEGWEYVDSICQSFSIAHEGFKGYGSVMVVLKRKK